MNYIVKVESQSKIIEYKVPRGTNLLQFLLQNRYEMYTPCNGKGNCGKCYVKISGGNTEEPTLNEVKILGKDAISEGYRLSCNISVNSDMEVKLERSGFVDARIVTEGKEIRVPLLPAFSKKEVQLPPPCLNDPRTDSERLKEFDLKGQGTSLDILKVLPEVLKERDYQVTLLYHYRELVGIEAGDTTSSLYGIGVDIGTTTVATYLLDLRTGKRVGTFSFLNPQRRYGADVISRIKHTLDNENGLAEMHNTLIESLNEGIQHLADEAKIKISEIYEISLVGNTTMIHFLLQLSVKGISASPFVPVTTEKIVIKASTLGLRINPWGIASVLPCVAAYVGADTVSAVLASEMDRDEKITLLIDFGTNGEIVLGNSEWLYACSTAAGPAFEGANISCGMGGVKGAVDKFKVEKDISYTTIGDVKPIGICGTGLIDMVAELLKLGIIDETGRIVTDFSHENIDLQRISERVTDLEGMKAFIVADKSITGNQKPIYLTQKDIRELQNAKAAIAAGIKIIAKKAGIRLEEIEKIYLAGGFGTFIRVESAAGIGLIPSILAGKVEAIGNAAGMGAIEALISKNSQEQAEEIKKKIQYIELSSCKEFNDIFIDSLFFSEEE